MIFGIITQAYAKAKGIKNCKQAGAELGQAQLPTGIWLYWV